MPRIRHWFHVTHDINADPEMWELRDKFGDRAGFVWLEILSIADRNDGRVGDDFEQLRNHLASKCRSTRQRVEQVLDWCLTRHWLVSDRPRTRLRPGSDPTRTDLGQQSDLGLRTRNHAEYHPSRDAKKNGTASPPLLPIPSLPKDIRDSGMVNTMVDAQAQSESIGNQLNGSQAEQHKDQASGADEFKRLLSEAGIDELGRPVKK